VNSVINQTYNDLELIVVNDFPDQDVSSILPDNDSIRTIQHKENKGAPVARNNGIHASDGEYIALLDDDDAWKPQKLEKQIKYFEDLDSSFGLVYTGRDVVYGDDHVEVEISDKEGWIHEVLLEGNIIPSETPLVRADCFNKVGLFDPDLPSCQDIDVWLRIAEEYKIGSVNESLAIAYRGHEDRISSNMDRKYKGHKKLVEKHKESFQSNSAALANQHKQIGIYAMRSNRTSEASSYLLSAYQLEPLDIIIPIYMLINTLPVNVREKLFQIRNRILNRCSPYEHI
jgi:glycosyltransferase involved in cell wall biosynthesis